MILVSHMAADCEETTLVSGEQTDSLVDLFAVSLLLQNGDLYYLVFCQCQCPFSDGIPAGKDLAIKADRCSQSWEK